MTNDEALEFRGEFQEVIQRYAERGIKIAAVVNLPIDFHPVGVATLLFTNRNMPSVEGLGLLQFGITQIQGNLIGRFSAQEQLAVIGNNEKSAKDILGGLGLR